MARASQTPSDAGYRRMRSLFRLAAMSRSGVATLAASHLVPLSPPRNPSPSAENPSRNAANLSRNAAFLSRNEVFLSRDAAFLSSNTASLSSDAAFTSRNRWMGEVVPQPLEDIRRVREATTVCRTIVAPRRSGRLTSLMVSRSGTCTGATLITHAAVCTR